MADVVKNRIEICDTEDVFLKTMIQVSFCSALCLILDEVVYFDDELLSETSSANTETMVGRY